MNRNWGLKPMFYDEIDIKNAREAGFWTGAMAGAVGMLMLCLLVGYFIL